MNHRPLASVLCIMALAAFLPFSPPALCATGGAIDRQAVVTRHNPRITTVDPESALSVGNGDFAFTVDATGFQCFDELHRTKGVPTFTLAAWAWHSFPNTEGHKLEDASKSYNVHGRQIPYIALERSPAGKYFRENPHPLPIGQFSLLYQNRELTPADLTAIDQTLDLWTGLITSRYLLDGQPVEVVTAAHPERSIMTARVRSPLLQNGRLTIRIRFPYAFNFAASKNNPPLIWEQPGAHTTKITAQGPQHAQIARTIDTDASNVKLSWDGVADLTEATPHDFRLTPAPPEAASSPSPASSPPPPPNPCAPSTSSPPPPSPPSTSPPPPCPPSPTSPKPAPTPGAPTGPKAASSTSPPAPIPAPANSNAAPSSPSTSSA